MQITSVVVPLIAQAHSPEELDDALTVLVAMLYQNPRNLQQMMGYEHLAEDIVALVHALTSPVGRLHGYDLVAYLLRHKRHFFRSSSIGRSKRCCATTVA